MQWTSIENIKTSTPVSGAQKAACNDSSVFREEISKSNLTGGLT
jgi:hypothetical protein